MQLHLRLLLLPLLVAAATGCQPASKSAADLKLTPVEKTVERNVVNLESKDHVKLGFSSLLVWAVAPSAKEQPDPAKVEAMFQESLREDLPKIVSEYRFSDLTVVHDTHSAASKVEARMLARLQERAAALPGTQVNRFIIRRLDLNESVQRQGIDELQRQRMQDIWRGAKP